MLAISTQSVCIILRVTIGLVKVQDSWIDSTSKTCHILTDIADIWDTTASFISIDACWLSKGIIGSQFRTSFGRINISTYVLSSSFRVLKFLIFFFSVTFTF